MVQDVSSSSTYDYGNALYWDARYLEEGGASFDWYQRYSALRPIVRRFVPTSSRVLVVGCGNAARPGFESSAACSSPAKSFTEPVPLTASGLLPAGFVPDDPDSHYVYVCQKIQ